MATTRWSAMDPGCARSHSPRCTAVDGCKYAPFKQCDGAACYPTESACLIRSDVSLQEGVDAQCFLTL
eukprot:1824324-Amphidinium_carterae.1